MTNEPRPIAIIGLSAWYPCGRDLVQFWANVMARRRAFRRLPEERLGAAYRDPDPFTPDTTYVERAALIDGFSFDWVGRRVPKQVYESADVVHWLALELAMRALDDAGYTKEKLPRQTTGVVVGNTLTGELSRANGLRLRWPYVVRALRESAIALGHSPAAIDELLAASEETFKASFASITEDTLPGVIPNTIAGRICNWFDFKGGGFAVDGACASSAIAIATAADALQKRTLDLALAGGVDVSIDPFELVGFAKIGALAKEDMYVYDKRSQGFFPGEGCGWVVLKRYEDAKRDGDRIYALLSGWGISSDGRGGLTAPSEDGQAIAVRRAYAMTGHRLADVDFVEGHGTGTAVGDPTELGALGRILQEEQAPRRSVGVTALKSMIGHTKAAAGIGSFVKAVLSVNQRVVPPLAGQNDRHPIFENTGAALYPISEGEVRPRDAKMRAGVSSFGFGGINVHLAIESDGEPDPRFTTVDPRAAFASAQDAEVYLFEAASPEALRAQIQPIAAEAARLSQAELGDLAAYVARAPKEGGLRAAVVANAPEELARKLETVLHMLKVPPAAGALQVDPMRDVWLSAGARGRRIAFLYPGQGAQALGMAKRLVERHAWARALVDEADAAVGAFAGGARLSELMFRPLHRALDEGELKAWHEALTDTAVAQPAITLASVLYTELLRRLGVTPAVVAGHSLGELSAFFAAGAFDRSKLFALAAVRGRAMAAPRGEAGTMAGLRAGRAEVEKLLARVTGYAVIANVNSDRQTVISGAPDAIDAVLAVAKQEGIAGQRLSVSNAFHSKYVAEGAASIARHAPFDRPLGALSVPLVSCVDGALVSPGLDLRAHFSQQIERTVEFLAVKRTLAGLADLAIEVGPGRVLTGLLAQSAPTKTMLALPVEPDPGSAKAFGQAVAACFAAGVAIDADALFADRYLEPYVRPSERSFIVNPCERPLEPPSAEARERLRSAGLEAALVERTGLDSDVVHRYLEARGDFLAAIVRADVGSAPAPIAEGAALKPANGAANGAPAKAARPAKPAPAKPAGGPVDIEALLIDLIAERTGFPKESIRPEMTLLNDLNIESIAAGDIIARAARAAGVTSRAAAPANLLQGSLRQVAEALVTAGGGNGAAGAANGAHAVPTDRGMATLLDTLAQLDGKPTWVRGFRLREHEAPLPAAPATAEPLQAAVVMLPDGGDVAAAVAQLRRSVLERGDVTSLVVARSSVNAPPPFAFAASIHLERPHMKVRAIDFAPSLAPEVITRAIAAELATTDSFTRARYDAGGARWTHVPELIEDEARPRAITWSKDDVLLVTGGAKGVTAELALALAASTGAKLALLGRSESAHPEVIATLTRLRELGATARYYAADVLDRAAVAEAVQAARNELGAISLVLHGAGVNRPARLGTEPEDDAYLTVGPKVAGLRNVLDALGDRTPKCVVALSSIIGFTGMHGNAWYALGNEWLDEAVAAYGRAHPETVCISTAFSLVAETGMAVKLSGVEEQLRRAGTAAVPLAEAKRLFVDAVRNDRGAAKVIFAARLGGLDTWTPRANRLENKRFLEDVLTFQPRVELVARTHLTLDKDPYLRDHVYKGTYLFPMVFGLEAMAQAVAQLLDRTELPEVRVEGIDLERPIVVDPQRGEQILVHAEVLERASRGEPHRVRVGITPEQAGFAKDHFSATFVVPVGTNGHREQPLVIARPEQPLAIDPVRDLYGRFLFHGAAFQRLRDFWVLRSDYAVYRAEQRQDASYVLGDPYFRDALLQAGQVVISQDRALPRRVELLELHPDTEYTALPLVEGRLDLRTSEVVECTIHVTGARGRVIQKLSGCRFAILEHRPDEPTAEEIADPDARDRRLLAERLTGLAGKLELRLPNVVLANMPGLGGLPSAERHAKERVVLERAVSQRLGPPSSDG